MTAVSSIISSVSSTTSSGLVQTGNGEYTAASVSTDPTDANKLGLVREKDGNYGTSNPNQVQAASSSATQVAASTQSAITGLLLGGA
jgi:hypothetical protein